MYHAETIEQFKIMKWLEANFESEGLRRVEPMTRNSVRITDRDWATALVVCRQDGSITMLTDEEEAC